LDQLKLFASAITHKLDPDPRTPATSFNRISKKEESFRRGKGKLSSFFRGLCFGAEAAEVIGLI
jgi:hypothetical protein